MFLHQVEDSVKFMCMPSFLAMRYLIKAEKREILRTAKKQCLSLFLFMNCEEQT